MSPGSSPSAFARTARRTIFALLVFGSAETNSTRSGVNAFPSTAATAALIPSGILLGPGLEREEDPRGLALHLVRHADRGGLDDDRMVDGGRLELGRARSACRRC